MSLLELASLVLLVAGSAFGLIGVAGLLRFPDFFTRMHAAGVTDTLAAGLILVGLMLQAGTWLAVSKLAFILFFLLFTSPTSSHALANAALRNGQRPWQRGDDHG